VSHSIDAALGWAERVLPGCEWELSRQPGGHYEFQLSLSGEYGWEPACPALAILKALVAALIAKEKRDEQVATDFEAALPAAVEFLDENPDLPREVGELLDGEGEKTDET
jgi:hypothetical protein